MQIKGVIEDLPPRKPGTTGYKPRSVEQVIKDFWKKVEKTSSCWIWTGYRAGGGKWYGMLNAAVLGPFPVYAHRLAWSLHTGKPVPKDKHVLHRCDNPGCVRFSHFFLGDMSANSLDMFAKGRSKIGGNWKKMFPKCQRLSIKT